MAQLIAGVGDIVVSNCQDDLLKTYALGSCVALIVYVPEVPFAALAHVALPDSSANRKRAFRKPGYFADTAVSELIAILKGMGVQKNNQVWVKLVGGANILDTNRNFYIGKRNVLAIKKHLWKYHLGAIAEDVGADLSRTVSVQVKDGKVLVLTNRKLTKIL
jgi:chemotaxis protein CheD